MLSTRLRTKKDHRTIIKLKFIENAIRIDTIINKWNNTSSYIFYSFQKEMNRTFIKYKAHVSCRADTSSIYQSNYQHHTLSKASSFLYLTEHKKTAHTKFIIFPVVRMHKNVTPTLF